MSGIASCVERPTADGAPGAKPTQCAAQACEGGPGSKGLSPRADHLPAARLSVFLVTPTLIFALALNYPGLATKTTHGIKHKTKPWLENTGTALLLPVTS